MIRKEASVRILFLFTVVFLLGVFLSGCKLAVDKEQNISEEGKIDKEIIEANVSYDSQILEEFKINEWVNVIIKLKDDSNIIDISEKNRWFEPRREEVLATLSENEFKLGRRSSRGFHGEINKKGFDKLLRDKRVDAIYWNRPVYADLLERVGNVG